MTRLMKIPKSGFIVCVGDSGVKTTPPLPRVLPRAQRAEAAGDFRFQEVSGRGRSAMDAHAYPCVRYF